MPIAVPVIPPTDLDAADATPTYRERRHAKVVAQWQWSQNRWVGMPPVDWSTIVLRADGGDDTCTLAVDALMIDRVNTQHFAELLDRLKPDRLVRVVASWGPGGRTVLFQGYPQPVTMSWGAKSQTMRVTCISQAQEKLRTGYNQHVRGRMMLLDPLGFLAGDGDGGSSGQNGVEMVAVGAMPTTFNSGGRPNRTPYAIPAPQSTNDDPGAADDENAEAAAVGPIHAFLEDDAPEAAYWTYAQTLRYLVWHYVYTAGAVVDVSAFLKDTEAYAEQEGVASNDPFVRRITARMPELSIESLNVDEALAVERIETKQRSHFSRVRTQVVDYGFDTYQLRDREAGNSFLAEQADDPAYSTRDDTQRMVETAERDIDRLSVTTTSGDPELFWLDDSYRVGDAFSGVEPASPGCSLRWVE